MSTETTFLELLPTIDRLANALCRKRGLVGADAEDFVAMVRARFVETDYSPLKQFRGDSSVNTYLAVVIASWLKDHIIARDGRWRPSAVALRSGPVAIGLERLLTHGRRSVDEAITELMASSGSAYSERELRAIIRTLPRRDAMRPQAVPVDRAAELPSATAMQADTELDSGERDLEAAAATRVLQAAMHKLDTEDRVMVCMRFMDGQSVAEIARALGLDQKPLYRRLERSLLALRRELESAGVTAVTVRNLLPGGE